MGALKIDNNETELLAKVLQELTGVVIPPQKRYLFSQRLTPVVELYGLRDVADLSKRVGTDPALRRAFIDALTTHETSFFRDSHPFETLKRKLLPDILGGIAARQRQGAQPHAFTIWSAACSTGKEVYTLAMIVDEVLRKNPQWGVEPDRIRILGTDVSEMTLETARRGVYATGEGLRGLPADYQRRYMEEREDGFHVVKALRKRCTFRQLDITRRFTMGPFDLVLCRNVLIYFDADTRVRSLERAHGTLAPGGVLLLGSSENVDPSLGTRFETKTLGRTRYFVAKNFG
ncbi:MAG: protein-glutamate O-methyltransferase CheR [Nannocystaceae bacterium]|nr:protein-glutamate O-methyltransferase CheR [Nannocystaceae bacterium]